MEGDTESRSRSRAEVATDARSHLQASIQYAHTLLAALGSTASNSNPSSQETYQQALVR